MSKGNIGVTSDNIFPVIKKFLYSDHEIFLRELISNAVDATTKLKVISRQSSASNIPMDDLRVRVKIDKAKKTLTVSDHGIGMTAEEVDKFINQIAFSGAEEFLDKYKDKAEAIIGHFGLGFYSSFMVADKVEIFSLSYQDDAKAVHWSCEGSPEYTMEETIKSERGTDVVLHINDEFSQYLEDATIEGLLKKYCKFLPVEIAFGKKKEWKDGKQVELDEENIINDTNPAWTRKPNELKDEDYDKFYHELYPTQLEEPLFHIHLNVDYPFNLTGILYFPKIKERMAIQKNKIQLYCNQMFVTDHVDNIVPDFLTLLHGVIDSPDIPLNVSRSYLQSDANVKKISTYITKKVADRLEDIFKTERTQLEEKWDNIKLFIEYGMLTEEKFCERALKFALLKNTDGKYFSLDEYKTGVEPQQTDKDKKIVMLYATDAEKQYTWIEQARNMGYDVLLMDCELDSHFVNLLEEKLENVRFARVDSDSVSNLIPKEEAVKPEMSEDDSKALSDIFKSVLPEGFDYMVEAQNLGEDKAPVLITQSEFLRRYREMSALGGGINFYGEMPEAYNIIVNMENPLIHKIWEAYKADGGSAEDFARGNDLLKQVTDLALLGNGMLKGKALSDFISRSQSLLSHE